jgi:hypothetical protein
VLIAALCVSGVTPAQQEESTVMLALSYVAALIKSALETTQMSVQNPMISMSSSPFLQISAVFKNSESSFEPKVGFSK